MGGTVARRLLAPAVMVPVFLGWLRWKGAAAGLYGQEAGLDLMVSSTMLLLVGITFWAALKLDRVDIDRKRVQNELHRTSAYNRSLIEASLDSLVTIAPDGKL